MNLLATEVVIWGMLIDEFLVYVPIGVAVVIVQTVLSVLDIRKTATKAEPIILSLSFAFLLIVASIVIAGIRSDLPTMERRPDLLPYLFTKAVAYGPLMFVVLVSAYGPVCVLLKRLIQPFVTGNAGTPRA